MSYNNNQAQIQSQINSTKTKKIIITKKYQKINASPQKIFNSNQVYNRRISPRKIKLEQKSPNKLYNIYQTQEIKENSDKNINDNDFFINKNDEYIIYNKEDFNNNKYYQNFTRDECYKENSNKKLDKTFSYDIIKNKNKHLVRYNYNYISPKKNSKVLLKNVICSPVIVSYTEIKDAELKSGKEYNEINEEIEETEMTTKNKIITIWGNNNKAIKESNFELLGEENLENKYIIESYEKKIKELNEIITNLKKEKEQYKKHEYLDNIIQSFNFKIKRKNPKSKIQLLKTSENNINIPPKPKFQNIKQNINSFNINKTPKPKNNKQLTAQLNIKSKRTPKIKNKIEKINDIYIPKQKKAKFTSDSIYGQELCILSKKKKKAYIIQQTHKFLILKNEKIPPPIQIFSPDEIFLEEKIKPENIIEQNNELFIEPTRKIQELNIEYQDSINLYEITKNINEIQNGDNFTIEGEDLPLYEIERVNEFNNYPEIKYKNDDLDIILNEDIFYDELPKPENYIEQIESLEYLSSIKEKVFNNNEIEKKEALEIIPEKNEENIECINKYKKAKYIYEFDNKNINIENEANFQIIAVSIRELYQQKLQGFSIIKKEKYPNQISRELSFMILSENNFNINHNSKVIIDTYNNKEINKSKKILKNNNKFYHDYNNQNTKKINTIISKNYRTFIAYPKKEIEYINPKEIFMNENSNKNNNGFDELYHSGDESLDKKNYLYKTYMYNNNEINKRYKTKILLRKGNNDNSNSNINKKHILSFHTTNKNNIISTPEKIKKVENKYSSENKTYDDNRLIRRKIYRFEEGKKVKIIKNEK